MRLNGQQEFTTGELMTIAGALGLSLSELLGEDIVNAKLPAPTYTEEKGKKKSPPLVSYQKERLTTSSRETKHPGW